MYYVYTKRVILQVMRFGFTPWNGRFKEPNQTTPFITVAKIDENK